MAETATLIPEGLMVRVADRLRVLGQPVRLRLVEQLQSGPSTPQELSDALCPGPAGRLTGSPFEPEAVIAALNHANVRYVIVGGLASGAHGVVRATRDLDLVPANDAANLEALALALTELQGQHPIYDGTVAVKRARRSDGQLQLVDPVT